MLLVLILPSHSSCHLLLQLLPCNFCSCHCSSSTTIKSTHTLLYQPDHPSSGVYMVVRLKKISILRITIWPGLASHPREDESKKKSRRFNCAAQLCPQPPAVHPLERCRIHRQFSQRQLHRHHGRQRAERAVWPPRPARPARDSTAYRSRARVTASQSQCRPVARLAGCRLVTAASSAATTTTNIRKRHIITRDIRRGFEQCSRRTPFASSTVCRSWPGADRADGPG